MRIDNNTTTVLETVTREMADEFYDALSEGRTEKQDMADVF